jgi:hypothetical protein
MGGDRTGDLRLKKVDLRKYKSEILISKSETNPNNKYQNSKGKGQKLNSKLKSIQITLNLPFLRGEVQLNLKCNTYNP